MLFNYNIERNIKNMFNFELGTKSHKERVTQSVT